MIVSMLFLSMTYAVSASTEVVVDSKTKLEWQNELVNKTATEVGWLEAIDYCENLNLDNKNDWRLPNINELKSLVDYTTFQPAIVSTLKGTTANNPYWSSTTVRYNYQQIYTLDFTKGTTFIQFKTDTSANVRCVRSQIE